MKTPENHEPAQPLAVPLSDQLGLVERLRQQWPDTPHHRDMLHREAADEIERAWAARDAAVADLEAHAEAEVRRAVAAERERCAAHIDVPWSRTGAEFAAAIRSMGKA